MSALTRCLEEEASAIATAAERLSSDQVEAALALLERCADRKAKLVITGVGKSGFHLVAAQACGSIGDR